MEEFSFSVHKGDSQEVVPIKLSATDTGWYVRHPVIIGDSGPDGFPFLFSCLNLENIIYPRALGDAFETIWLNQRRGEISTEIAGKMLEDLVVWVNGATRSQPRWISRDSFPILVV